LTIQSAASMTSLPSLAVTPGSPGLPGSRACICSQFSSEIAWGDV
jgi:hypothetical protein